VYLHVFTWPAYGGLVVGGLEGEVQRAYLLADAAHKPLKTKRLNAADLLVQGPETAPDAMDTVVVVEMKGPLQVAPGRLIAAGVERNQLLAFDAQTEGTAFTFGDGKKDRYPVSGLQRACNRLVWNIRADEPLQVRVVAKYSTPPGDPGDAKLRLQYGDQVLEGKIKGTGAERSPVTIELGTLKLVPGAQQQLAVSASGAKVAVGLFELELQSLK
jgi:hypothetical protein